MSIVMALCSISASPCTFLGGYDALVAVDPWEPYPIRLNWPRGYKTFFMLNSTEHEFFPAHKC